MSNSKRLLTVLACGAAVVGLTGCSGVNYTHGVSPATFLLPGIVEHTSRPASPLVAQPVAPVEEVALLSSKAN